MAKFHKNLHYHEDTTEKHDITKEELDFLSDLQHELNTQDHVGQADPRFWVIMGQEKQVVPSGYEDDVTLYDNDAAEELADGIDNIIKFLNKKFKDDGEPWEITQEYSGYTIKSKKDDEYDEYLCDLEELEEWLHEHNHKDCTFHYYSCKPKVYPDTMFLTEKSAANHLKENYYHYDDTAHTYAMTAWRSPEVEKLIKILQTVDFSNIISNIIANKE